jgi:ABC-type Fe3+/spermidine/putrescine transport system ATPase subunit
MSYFSLRALTKSYDSHTALQEFNLELSKGEFVSIIGESGSGKSTLLRIAAGLLTQSWGEVLLGGKKIESPAEKLVPGYDEIKLIHQDYQLFPNTTVEENITRPLLNYEEGYRKQRVAYLLDRLGLTLYKDRLPKQLSGGQQQKVAIAQALAVEPEVLLLDEPFSHLDAIQKRKLIQELKVLLQEMDTTVIFVTHDLDDALWLTDSLVVLQKGKITQMGNSKALCEHPKSKYVARLFSSINALPDQERAYIRPADIRIRTRGGFVGHVVDQRFLVHYNTLQVRLREGGQIWEVDDPGRKYQIGDRVYLHVQEEKILVLKS